MKCNFAVSGIVYAVCVLMTARAQSFQPVDVPPPDSQPVYVPLTFQQDLFFGINKVMGPGGLALVSLKSGFDQLRDEPRQWGPNADSLAVRAASRFGRSFVRQGVALGVRELDGEDPRYYPLGQGTGWERTRYAIGHSFLAKNRQGKWMPAYSVLIANFATPFIAYEWRPDYQSVPRGFRAGAAGLSFAVGSSVFQEFWPDVKARWLRRHDRSGNAADMQASPAIH
jgi:hypothetical protein